MKTAPRLVCMVMSLSLFSGCATAVLTKRVFKPKPGGVVKYQNSVFMGDKSRKKAEEIMNDHCGGQGYTVVSEATGTELGPVYGTNYKDGRTQINQSSSDFVYIEFSCGH